MPERFSETRGTYRFAGWFRSESLGGSGVRRRAARGVVLPGGILFADRERPGGTGGKVSARDGVFVGEFGRGKFLEREPIHF